MRLVGLGISSIGLPRAIVTCSHIGCVNIYSRKRTVMSNVYSELFIFVLSHNPV